MNGCVVAESCPRRHDHLARRVHLLFGHRRQCRYRGPPRRAARSRRGQPTHPRAQKPDRPLSRCQLGGRADRAYRSAHDAPREWSRNERGCSAWFDCTSSPRAPDGPDVGGGSVREGSRGRAATVARQLVVVWRDDGSATAAQDQRERHRDAGGARVGQGKRARPARRARHDVPGCSPSRRGDADRVDCHDPRCGGAGPADRPALVALG
jgi:hypothetical protein